MDKKAINKRIKGIFSEMRGVVKENQTPAPETDPEYEIKNYPRLLQLARAGLVPDELVYKMTNVLKDPKRFGVAPKIRNQLYNLMIKTLNYIVVSDPAAWARFRAFLMKENTSIIEPKGETEMDKIEKYKNLNEKVDRMLREHTDAISIEEQVNRAAQELVEALEDPNRVTALMRSGLVDTGKVARVRTALKDPEKAMKNATVRSDLISMLMTLINVVTSNPSVYANVRKSVKKGTDSVVVEEETLQEGGVKGALEDWLYDLPKKVVAEIKSKFGKKLKAAEMGGGFVIDSKTRDQIRQVLVRNKVKPLLGDKNHAEGTTAIIMSFHTFHGDLDESVQVEVKEVEDSEKKLSKTDLRTLRQVNLAKTLRDMK